MTGLSPRRRIMVVCAVALLVGFGVQALGAAYASTEATMRWLRWLCDPGTAVCQRFGEQGPWLLPYGFATLIGLVVLAIAGPWAAAWVLRPVRDIVPLITQVGPQNLGHRLRPSGGTHDELTQLSLAVDAMMDRIMAGYESQRRFAANASHELRTPLAVQRMLVEVGMASQLSDEQFALLTAQLLRTNERNERLVDGLLVLSEADQGLAVRLPQHLDRIAASVIAAHTRAAEAADVRITGDLRPRVVTGEDVLLERLVTNLVQNAIKYNHPGGTVHVTVGDTPALVVVNTGQQVPADAVTELFEPFKRLAADRVDHSGGAGLGLAIARSITQAHDGTITATAQPSGGGLRVEVRLPQP